MRDNYIRAIKDELGQPFDTVEQMQREQGERWDRAGRWIIRHPGGCIGGQITGCERAASRCERMARTFRSRLFRMRGYWEAEAGWWRNQAEAWRQLARDIEQAVKEMEEAP